MNTSPSTIAALWVAICLAVNGFIFAVGWNDGATLPLTPAWKPPGWAIGVVWTGLFACMGYAHGLLLRRGNRFQWGVALLLVACLAYPFYTGGLQSGLVAFYGTIITLAYTLVLLTKLTDQPRWLLLPVALWLCFATVLIHATLQLNALGMA